MASWRRDGLVCAIDRSRIGAAGISLGGYTVLVLAGARADSRLLIPYGAHKPKTPWQRSLSKAVLSVEPGEGPAIIPESLSSISIPIAFIAGLGDRILPILDNIIPVAIAVPNAQVTLFPKPAGQYTFLVDCTRMGRRKYPVLCDDAGPERLTVHHDAIAIATSFFCERSESHHNARGPSTRELGWRRGEFRFLSSDRLANLSDGMFSVSMTLLATTLILPVQTLTGSALATLPSRTLDKRPGLL